VTSSSGLEEEERLGLVSYPAMVTSYIREGRGVLAYLFSYQINLFGGDGWGNGWLLYIDIIPMISL